MSCGGIARDVMREGERTASGAAKELRGGLKYPLGPPGGALNSLWCGSCGMPADSAGGGTCGGIARGIMWEGERTASGLAKELDGGHDTRGDSRGG